MRRTGDAYYVPGCYRTTRKYTVETIVYSLKRDKLRWRGVTTSVDPSNVDKLMNATASAVY